MISTILHTLAFLPHAYATLDAGDRSVIPQAVYEQYVQEYQTTTDIDCSKIIYTSDGLSIVGFLCKPQAMNPTKKYPVIIFNRGGSAENGKINVAFLITRIFPLVRAGYVVLASQYRGCDGSQGVDELGGNDVHDVINLCALAQQLPYVNPSELYMVGYSRGALMTCRALKEGVHAKAIALIAGVTDLFLFERLRPDAVPILQELIPNYATNKEQVLWNRSVICWPEALNVPVLLMHGDADVVVNVQASHNLYAALKNLNMPCELAIYPGENHGLQGNDVNARIINWFAAAH